MNTEIEISQVPRPQYFNQLVALLREQHLTHHYETGHHEKVGRPVIIDKIPVRLIAIHISRCCINWYQFRSINHKYDHRGNDLQDAVRS